MSPVEHEHNERTDIVIVGAGWSGILAAKYAREHGLSVIVLEARSTVGGVWSYTSDQDVVTVAEYTRTTSSVALTEASDFPMPKSFGPFPTHTQVLRYLHDYIDHFGLRSHIRLSSPVRRTQRTSEGWRVQTQHGVIDSRFLIIGTGTHGQPNPIPFAALQQFEGRILHAEQVKQRQVLLDEAAGQRVLLIGGGETAADIIEMLVKRGSPRTIDWSIPNGQRFVRKYGTVLPYMPFSKVIDENLTTFSARHIPVAEGRPGTALFARLYTTGSMTAYSGHNIPEWTTEARYFHSHLNKNGAVLDHVYDGLVGAKRRPISVSGHRITFDRGTPADYDVVISCFGYRPKHFDFLPASHAIDPGDCWRYIFHPDDPSMMYIGYARPVVSSIPLMTEAQCKLAMRVMTGQARLPDDLYTQIAHERAEWRDYFRHTSQRIRTLVEPMSYFYGLMAAGGFEPDFKALFMRDPIGAIIAYCAPMKAALIHLSEPEREAQALNSLRQHTDIWLVCANIIVLMIRKAKLDPLAQRAGQWKLRLDRRYPGLRQSRAYHTITHAFRRYLTNHSTFSDRTPDYTAALDETVPENDITTSNHIPASTVSA